MAHTPQQKGFRTFYQTVGATLVAFFYGLWQLPGVSDYVHSFVANQGFSLVLALAGLIGIPAGLISYFQNKKGL